MDILAFSYELETIPKTDLAAALPSLEAAFVDSILSVVFPLECQTATARYLRLLQEHTVIGVSSDPADEITNGKNQIMLSFIALNHDLFTDKLVQCHQVNANP